LDLTYTEWRSKNWFNRTDIINTGSGGQAWNSQLNKSAIPQGGACIAGMSGFHQFCDDKVVTGFCEGDRDSANNVYIRDTGTCVNSAQFCQIKGVDFRDNEVTDGGLQYPSCVDTQGTVSQALFGSTITRAVNAGTKVCIAFDPIDHVETGSAALNTLTNGLIDVVNGAAEACITVAETLANEALPIVAGLAITTDAIADVGQQVALYAAGSQSGALTTALGGSVPQAQATNPLQDAADMAAYYATAGMQDGVPIQGVSIPPGSGGSWDHPSTPKPPGVVDAVLPTATTKTRTLFKTTTPNCQNGDLQYTGQGAICDSCPEGTTKVTAACLSCPPGYTLSSDGAWCYKCPNGSLWRDSTQGCASDAVNTITLPRSVTNDGWIAPNGYSGACPSGKTTAGSYDCTSNPQGFCIKCASCPAGSIMTSYSDTTTMYGDTRWCIGCPAGYKLSSDNSYCINA
jgi:hypothetical protein